MTLAISQTMTETYLPVKSILISQPKPERSPYFELENKWNVSIEWQQFIQVEDVTEKEFRKTKIRLNEFSSIVFTSKNAIDHFFRLCEAMRVKVDQNTKYFCKTKAVADYLQKYIVYRKRKVFYGESRMAELELQFIKHKDNETFLLPCSDVGAQDAVRLFEKLNLPFVKGIMYRTVNTDLSELSNVTVDILVFFSPREIDSLFDNFPNFKQNNTRIAVFGKNTELAVLNRGLKVNICVPNEECTSMQMGIEKYLEKSNVLE